MRYVYLDDGSLWERSSNKWILKKMSTHHDPLDDILTDFKTDVNNLQIDQIQNFFDSSLIYSPGFPYEYMNDIERKRHGYIQCTCCKIGKSCGNLRYIKKKILVRN